MSEAKKVIAKKIKPELRINSELRLSLILLIASSNQTALHLVCKCKCTNLIRSINKRHKSQLHLCKSKTRVKAYCA